MGETHAHGSPSFFWLSVETDGWLREGMPFAPLARLERLNAVGLENFNSMPDSRIELTRRGQIWTPLLM